mgnify:CR=1 FL=1
MCIRMALFIPAKVASLLVRYGFIRIFVRM